MKLSVVLTAGLAIVFVSNTVLPEGKKRYELPLAVQKSMRIHQTKPRHLEGPLRYENISDIEVREIESTAREVVPGAIVNISGVTTGCPCEDGSKCTDQVWIVAYRPDRSLGLLLSKIDGHWTVGPVQRWWLRWAELSEAVSDAPRSRDAESTAERIRRGDVYHRHADSFPVCAAQPQQADIRQTRR